MTEPTVLRWPLPTGAGTGGEPYSCPECGAAQRLTAALDLEDWSAEPTYMTCPAGHLWAEERFPRWIGADIFRLALEVNPHLLEDIATLHALQAEGDDPTP